jgi:hypothetical protein
MKMPIQILKCLIISAFLILLSSCANFPIQEGETPGTTDALTPSVESYPSLHFEDLPVPSGFAFKRAKSFIYESRSGSLKVGHLFFAGWNNLDETIAFFQNEMINKDWTFVRTMEHGGTQLLYEKTDKVCEVTIRSSLGQTQIEITIGPK